MKTTAAQTAKAIRTELKGARPLNGIKFRVTSSTYAGGDSVRVSFQDHPDKVDLVNEIADKYQMGNFNGMEDIYEYDTNPDLPQVKFTFVENTMTESMKDALAEYIQKHYGIEKDQDQECMDRFHCWYNQLQYRVYRDEEFHKYVSHETK